MATWANALNEAKLDIAQGGPAIVWEIASHSIGSGASEDFQINRLDVRHKSSTTLALAGPTVSSGTGIPKIYAVYLDEQNNELSEVELQVGENKVVGQFLKLRVKETNGAAATYSAAVRLD